VSPLVRIDVITIFPELVAGFAGHSLLGRAVAGGEVDLRVHDLRDATTDVHRTVDDAPFGGGAGMVLRPLRGDRPARPGPRGRRGVVHR
jgi:tRNA (guanine37-N1)-methyltransferase